LRFEQVQADPEGEKEEGRRKQPEKLLSGLP
jgi:hypothetical protein